jgi:YVTN family beta-propeller protein
MWDTKTLALIKTIEIDAKSRPDGILADPFNQRIYVFSHPTKDATVIDAKNGAVLGTIDLGGAPEQAVTDGKGHLYVVIQDKANVAVIDAKTMKVTAHYDFGDKGSGGTDWRWMSRITCCSQRADNRAYRQLPHRSR